MIFKVELWSYVALFKAEEGLSRVAVRNVKLLQFQCRTGGSILV